MKILIVSLGEHPAPGGVDTYIRMVEKALTQRGHEVDLLCYSNTNILSSESLTKIKSYKSMIDKELGGKIPKILLDFEIQKFVHKEMLSYLDIKQYDVIHSQSGITSQAIKDVYPYVPLVGTIHSCLYTEALYEGWAQNTKQAELFRRYDYSAVSCPDKVITISSVLDENMVPIPSEKYELIFNSIDTENFRPNQRTGDIIRIAASGLLVYRKGYDILLKAIAELLQNKNRFEVSIFGYGPAYESLNNFIIENKLPVTLHGYIERERLISELCNYDIFVQPSRTEPFGFSVTEAMASGCVPICSKVGGLQEQVKHLYNGLLFESENVKELSNAIQILIDNKHIISKMQINALKVVHEKFSLDSFGGKLEKVYSKIRLY